jgi:hypothetical protein
VEARAILVSGLGARKPKSHLYFTVSSPLFPFFSKRRAKVIGWEQQKAQEEANHSIRWKNNCWNLLTNLPPDAVTVPYPGTT